MLAVVFAEASELQVHPAARYAATVAGLARQHELVVVYGEPGKAGGGPTARDFLAALRAVHPAPRVVGLLADLVLDGGRDDATVGVLAEMLNDGLVPVVVSAAQHGEPSAAVLRAMLGGDLVFRLTVQGILRSVRTLAAEVPSRPLEVA